MRFTDMLRLLIFIDGAALILFSILGLFGAIQMNSTVKAVGFSMLTFGAVLSLIGIVAGSRE